MTTGTITFIDQLYSNILHRSADTEGKTYWQDTLDTGHLNAAEVTRHFIESEEFSTTVAPVIRLYYTLFERMPDPDGLAYWCTQAQNGASIESITQAFMASDEYQTQFDSDTVDNDSAFLDQLYTTAFDRAPDAEGKAFWLEALNDSSMSHTEVITAIAESSEMLEKTASQVETLISYISIIDRVPTTEELDQALNTDNPVQLITSLYSSNEYTGVDVPGLSQSGVAVDGYFMGATVTLTVIEMIDGVETIRTETRITDENGHFDFGEDAGFGTLTMTGGIDISTGVAFEGTLTAPAGSKVINPITTLIDQIAQANGGGSDAVNDAMAAVSSSFNLDPNLNLIELDPVKEALRTDTSTTDADNALAVQAAAAQINTLTTQIAALLDGTDAAADEVVGNDAAVQALAELLQDSTDVDLTSTETIQQLISQSASIAGADESQQTAIDNLAADAAQTITQLTGAIEQAHDSNADNADALKEIAQVQVVAEKVEDELEQGAETDDLSEANRLTEEQNLADAMADEADNITVGSENGAVYEPETESAPDTTPPVMRSVQVNADGDIEITWSEFIAHNTIEIGDFTVSVDGTPGLTITGSAVSNNTLTLYTASKLHNAQTVDSIAYAAQAGTADSIMDVRANAATDHSITSITNNSTIDVTAPTISSISVNAAGNIEINWSEAVTGASLDPSDFTVTVGGVTATISSTQINGNTVTLTMATGIETGELINSVAYTASDVIKDAANHFANATTVTSGISNNSSLDTITPAAPTISLTADSDNGASSSDALSNDTTPTIRVALTGTGTTAAVAGDSVSLMEGSQVVGTAVLTATDITAGYVDITTSHLGGDGVKTLTATITDQAAPTPHTSVASTALSYTLDTDGPTGDITPQVSSVSLSTDTGNGNSGTDSDNLTNTAAQTITVTLNTVLASGEFLYGSSDGGSHWTALTHTSGNMFTLDATLQAGVNSLLFALGDEAGNVSSATYAFAATLDNTAPTTTAGSLVLSADTGTAADFITHTASQTITATLSAALAADEILLGRVDGGSWVNISSDVTDTTLSWSTSLATGTGKSIELKVTDTAGNDGAVLSQAYALDTTAPTSELTGASYDAATNTLSFTGTNLTTLLEASESATTDIKGRLNWNKLQWDIDSDDTDNLSFTLSDISSAVVTDGTTLTVVLGDTKATTLEGTTGFDALNTDDTVEISNGFITDTAGNSATGDAFDGPVYPDTTVVVFDFLSGNSSSHSNRSFDANETYTIYLRVDADQTPAEAIKLNAGQIWGGAQNLGADDSIVLVGDDGRPQFNVLSGSNAQTVDVAALSGLSSNSKYFWGYQSASAFRLKVSSTGDINFTDLRPEPDVKIDTIMQATNGPLDLTLVQIETLGTALSNDVLTNQGLII